MDRREIAEALGKQGRTEASRIVETRTSPISVECYSGVVVAVRAWGVVFDELAQSGPGFEIAFTLENPILGKMVAIPRRAQRHERTAQDLLDEACLAAGCNNGANCALRRKS